MKLTDTEQELLDIEERRMRTLTGNHKHYCMDWDGMAIDDTCPEFECCTCIDVEGRQALKGGDNG